MDELDPKVIAAIASGRKIEAIKLVREQKGIGLKEAKEWVDAYIEDNDLPSASTAKGGSNSNVVFFIILGITVFFIYKHFA